MSYDFISISIPTYIYICMCIYLYIYIYIYIYQCGTVDKIHGAACKEVGRRASSDGVKSFLRHRSFWGALALKLLYVTDRHRHPRPRPRPRHPHPHPQYHHLKSTPKSTRRRAKIEPNIEPKSSQNRSQIVPKTTSEVAGRF